ncbi:MAG: preprotein translocase subunit SecA [Candidatus Binatota bacterium]|nr:preprotein translocase subunit SecA [Candidatus Binatota bacterium]
MSNAAFAPIGVPRGAYAERRPFFESHLEQSCVRLAGPVAHRLHARRLACDRFVQAVAAQGAALQNLDGHRLNEFADDLRLRLRQRSWRPEVMTQTFALVREVAARALGMRHFDVQVMGGWILLNGMIAEMDTGEGKTLTATLPVSTVALAGLPVHVVTVNDYLAQRDAGLMRPLYRALGLSVGVVTSGMSAEARRQAYACDVTYCTNKDLVFDYLRDRIALGRKPGRIQLQIARLAASSTRPPQLLLRGLHFAIVDEADSVLIDEARTPLIISRDAGDVGDARQYEEALGAAAELEAGIDYVIAERERLVKLTDSGRTRLTEFAPARAGISPNRWQREELVRQALTALHLMQRDAHYLIKDNKVQIIDESTGRIMADRSWEHGLHQLIEAKEGCAVTRQNDPLSRISYQGFFRRYRRLAGMTGTAREVRGELWSVYGLAVVRVPTNHPPRRVHRGDSVYTTAEAKWQAVLSRVTELSRQQRPILIGTRSVAASEHLSELLSAAAIPHQVLNARQDEAEAEIIARAGEPGQITVATNMAGRGTDIRLAPGVAQQGGLHVIGTERHEARRIDRQLWGRCGRQGDPGSYESIVSLEDELVAMHGNALQRWAVGALQRYRLIGPWMDKLTLYWAQRAAERLHSRLRRALLDADERVERALAFTGRIE